MAVARTAWERRRGSTTSSGSRRGVGEAKGMSIAAASAQLLEVDGAERARAGALAPRCGGRGRALHPPPPAGVPAPR